MSNVTEYRKGVQGLLATGCLLVLGSHGLRTQAQTTSTPARPLVEIRTELGTMVVALYNETPLHRDNFLKLVREQAYDSLLFHRIIPGFMAQGGDPDSKRAAVGAALGQGGPGYTLPAEIQPGLVHTKGALAAALHSDPVNPERRSNGSQFYIVLGKPFQVNELEQVVERSARNGIAVAYTEEQKKAFATRGGAPHLDGGYTVFGQVVDGLEILDALCAVTCDSGDRPVKDIRMFMRARE